MTSRSYCCVGRSTLGLRVGHFLLDAWLTEQHDPHERIGQSHCRVFLHLNPKSPLPYQVTCYPILAPMIWGDPCWLQGLARWAYDQCQLSHPDYCPLLILIDEDIKEVTVCVFKLGMTRWMRGEGSRPISPATISRVRRPLPMWACKGIYV